jgi:hypothetical protein
MSAQACKRFLTPFSGSVVSDRPWRGGRGRGEHLNLKLQIVDIEKHARGKIYKVSANGKAVLLLLTFHALERMKRWKLSDRQVLRTLLEPD